MVQMKGQGKQKSGVGVTRFISHMVQMKEEKEKNKKVYKVLLYIPHGSDERRVTAWGR